MTSTIWTEKYRPQTFDDVVGQRDCVHKLRAFVAAKNIPHLLFTGPPGVGKTTLALVVARTLFGEGWRSSFLELNASDERGIDVIRHKVKDFARTRAIGNAPFKIIYLDECDALTREAQQALRRTMENYTTTTRFILSANYSSKIIDPIQSRCAMFRFRPISKDEFKPIVEKISREEGLRIDEKALDALYEAGAGDCRKIENVLQSCSAITKDITEETVFSMASIAHPKEIRTVLELARDGDFIDARKQLLHVMTRYGMSGTDVIKQMQSETMNLDMGGRAKMELIKACGEAEFRLSEGSDPFVQLEAFLATAGLIGNKKETA